MTCETKMKLGYLQYIFCNWKNFNKAKDSLKINIVSYLKKKNPINHFRFIVNY